MLVGGISPKSVLLLWATTWELPKLNGGGDGYWQKHAEDLERYVA
jgi:hypothetical protein